jgi:hypothetical protein
MKTIASNASERGMIAFGLGQPAASILSSRRFTSDKARRCIE